MRRPEFVARQGSRPEGWLGSLLALVMRWETAAENDAALDLLRLEPTDRYLEVGFGHARTLAKAAAGVRVAVGVDASADMVRRGRRLLGSHLATGYLELYCTAGPELPFPAAAFDKILCMHTLYFWPAPVAHLAESRRVMANGGRLVLGVRPDSPRLRQSFPASIYAFYSRERLREMLAEAGFMHVAVQPTTGGVDLWTAEA